MSKKRSLDAGVRRAAGIGALGASIAFVGQMALADGARAAEEPNWCRTEYLSASVQLRGVVAGTQYADLYLRNSSDNDCELNWNVGLKLLDAEGNPLPTRVVRPSGKPKLVPVEYLSSARLRISWTTVPKAGEPAPCQPAPATLDVDPPTNEPEPMDIRTPWDFGPVCNNGQIRILSIS
ncbi:DUF4232 domain-containing protein [Actinomadura sp. 6N118]|uniref:DUF4232 domain-containing protein n=1 Tax=Actinomadura sp. 6N118 TaxID=3375151 RepID=UPI0037A887A0